MNISNVIKILAFLLLFVIVAFSIIYIRQNQYDDKQTRIFQKRLECYRVVKLETKYQTSNGFVATYLKYDYSEKLNSCIVERVMYDSANQSETYYVDDLLTGDNFYINSCLKGTKCETSIMSNEQEKEFQKELK